MSSPLDDDPEFRDLLERQRRHGLTRAIWMVLTSLAVAAGGAAMVAYGRTLDAAQAHAEVRFLFPERLRWIGWMLAGVGVLAAVVCTVVAARMRLRRGL